MCHVALFAGTREWGVWLMTFLTPLFAALAAAVAIPTLVILYFLKLRRQTVEVSTTLLWKKAIEDLQANAPFQRLRRNLLLFLQLLALAAALFAIAQPQLSATGLGGVRHVILIDRSASMQARDGDEKNPSPAPGSGKTRLERAKEEARRVVDSMREASFLSAAAGGAGDEAMVIAFDATAEVRQNFTPSKAALRAAIDAIEPGDDSSSLKEAIKLAKAYSPRAIIENKGLIASGPPARIHIISDGRLPDAASATDDPNKAALELTPEDEVLFHAVGSRESSNLGIVGLRAERSFDKPGTMSVFVGVQSSDKAARTVDVELSVEGQVAAIRSLTLPPATVRVGGAGGDRRPAPGRDERGTPRAPELSKPETDAAPAPEPPPSAPDGAGAKGGADVLVPSTGGVVFALERAEGAVIVARLRSPTADPLPVDDFGYLVVPPAKRLSVALVTPGNLFVREALEGMNLAKLEVFTPADAGRVLDDPKKKAEFDVFVLDRWLPKPAGPGKHVLPAGRFLVFGAVPPPPLGLIDRGLGEGTVIVDWRRDHPVLRGINLDSLIINPGRLTEKRDGTPVSVLAQAQGGPAIVEAGDEQTRVLAVTFDVTASSWPFDPGFVLFTAAGLGYLANDGAATTEGLRPGATLAERLPAGARNATVVLPDNSRADLLPTGDGRVVYGPLRKVGIYTLSWSGPAGAQDSTVDGRARRALAVNLLDPQESDIAAADKLSLPSRVVQAQAGSGGGTRRLWPFMLLLALAVMLVEWYIYNRKVMI